MITFHGDEIICDVPGSMVTGIFTSEKSKRSTIGRSPRVPHECDGMIKNTWFGDDMGRNNDDLSLIGGF